MNLRARFLELQSLLTEHESVWRPAPFHVRRPQWCARWPALATEVLALDETDTERFSADPEACAAWLAPKLPVIERLATACALPELPARILPAIDARLADGIPGRKHAQIEAFAAHTPPAPGPLLEWCAGKGHLGRRLAQIEHQAVTSLEIDPTLCAEAERLARRARVAQDVVCGDAFAPAARAHVHGHTVCALHACGELHRHLVRSAAQDGALAYRIAPCCYHLGTDGSYRPLSRDARLALDAAALRLAVTETVTAPRHDRSRLARDQAWKLGFVALREALADMGEDARRGYRQSDVAGEAGHGPAATRNFRPVPAAWLTENFEAFCRKLAAREQVGLPAAVDWAGWEAAGEHRRAEVRRLELVRHAFRRALEHWLVLDLALGLEERGFDVQVGCFCARALTPRNLLVLAQRRATGLTRGPAPASASRA
ncbi:MAG: methyltransferase [Thauera sp.]